MEQRTVTSAVARVMDTCQRITRTRSLTVIGTPVDRGEPASSRADALANQSPVSPVKTIYNVMDKAGKSREPKAVTLRQRHRGWTVVLGPSSIAPAALWLTYVAHSPEES